MLVDVNLWIVLECGVIEKFLVIGSMKGNIFYVVYLNFDVMWIELESGYFVIKMEFDDRDDYGRK